MTGHTHNHSSYQHGAARGDGHAGHNHHEIADFSGASPAYRRVLWTVIALNAGMFAVEVVAGAMARSTALWADSLDFAADAATYGLSLWAIGQAPAVRARIATVKGLSLAVMAALVLGVALWRAVGQPVPEAATMGVVGVLALAANVASALLLWRWRAGDANVRSVWLCTRNDAVGNVAVMAAAGAVALTGTGWPDLIVAMGMAALFLSSSISILRQSGRERRAAAGEGGQVSRTG